MGKRPLIAADQIKTRTARHSKVAGEMRAVYRRFAVVKRAVTAPQQKKDNSFHIHSKLTGYQRSSLDHNLKNEILVHKWRNFNINSQNKSLLILFI